MAPCYQVRLSGRNLRSSSPRVEAWLQLFGKVMVQKYIHSKYFCFLVFTFRWSQRLSIGQNFAVMRTKNIRTHREMQEVILYDHGQCVNRIYAIMAPTREHKYAKVSFIHAVNYTFRPTMWLFSGM
jgi:hypothetical protein